MKSITFLTLIFSILAGINHSNAAQTGAEYPAEIEDVTVYLQGAEISSTAEINVSNGENIISITGISPYIDPNSIRLMTEGFGKINSVRHRVNYLKFADNPKVKSLQSSIDSLADIKDLLEAEKEILKSEAEMLRSNLTLKNNPEIPTTASMQSYSDFYRQRMMEISKKLIAIENSFTKIAEEKSAYENERNQYLSADEHHTIEVDYSADRSGKETFTFAYNISQAGWTPNYDLYVFEEKTDLIYKGTIWQKSGLDWENIDLRLSTTRPSYNNSAPSFQRMYVDIFRETDKRYSNRINGDSTFSKEEYQRAPVTTNFAMLNLAKGVNLTESGFQIRGSRSSESLVQVDGRDIIRNGDFNQQFTQIDNGLDVVYEVPKKYTIENGEKEKTVNLQARGIEAERRYLSIPRFSEKVYLIADLDKSLASELISGSVSVFFNGGYTGKTYLNMNTSEDKISVTVTADDRLKIKRRLIRDFAEDKFLSSDIEKFFAYEFTLENNKNQPVEVEVIDMLPIAQSEDVEVEFKEGYGSVPDEKTGKIKWDVELAPLGSKKINYVYTLRYPSSMNIQTTFRD